MFPVSLGTHKYAGEEGVQPRSSRSWSRSSASTAASAPVLADILAEPGPDTSVFRLRDGVKFSDGTPFTAKDVVASYHRHRSSKARSSRSTRA